MSGGGVSFPRLTHAVKILLIINAAVALLQLIWFMSTGGNFANLLGTSLDNFLDNPLRGVVSLVTYQFVHKVLGLGHLFGNALILYFFGSMVEQRIGAKGMAWLYLGTGVLGGIFWWLFSALAGIGMVPCIGASGAAYGIMAYAALTAPMSMVILIVIPVRLWVLAAGLGVFALYATLVDLRLGPSGTANAAHVGGALAGALAWWQRDWIRGLGYRMANAGKEREARRAREREKRLDQLLQKIKELGITALSKSERRFLSRYSKDRRD
jgi:membrane associated rhomboid family serine protease